MDRRGGERGTMAGSAAILSEGVCMYVRCTESTIHDNNTWQLYGVHNDDDNICRYDMYSVYLSLL